MLREKGPTAVKRRFKNAVNCVFLVCYVTSLLQQVNRSSTHFTQEKIRKKRGQPHSPNLKSRNAFKLPHTAQNNVQ